MHRGQAEHTPSCYWQFLTPLSGLRQELVFSGKFPHSWASEEEASGGLFVGTNPRALWFRATQRQPSTFFIQLSFC